MIVNAYSVLVLFMAALGMALAGFLLATSLWAAWRIRAARGEQGTSAAERSVHLARLVAVVSLAIQLLGWPLFYAMLASFVPEIPGAMCMYGVTKVMPGTAAAIQAATPVVVFLLGAWLLLERVQRRAGRPPRRAGGVLALAALAGLVAAADGTRVYYVLNMKSLNPVSCCSSYGQTGSAALQAPSYYLPWVRSGPPRRAVLAALFFAGVPLLGFWLLRKPARGPGRRPRRALAENVALVTVTLGLAAGWLMAFSEVLASWLMRLPLHHCLYCLVTNGRVPDSPLILANLAIGTFAAGWAGILGIAVQVGLPAEIGGQHRRKLCMLGTTTLWAALLMVVVHLVV